MQYIVVDTLGRGSFGKVKLCLNTGDDTLYAVKVVNTRAVSGTSVDGVSWTGWPGTHLPLQRGIGGHASHNDPPPALAASSQPLPHASSLA